MYAKEKIKPKLFDLDQDKLARLFADLRRESMATGSYPITVRHLESMIRMAEASAKMALREYVRPDDIDLAIEVAIGSFVSAQKLSIKKTLQRVSAFSISCLVSFLTFFKKFFSRDSASTSLNQRITKNCSPSYWAVLSKKKLASTSYKDTSILIMLSLS